MAGLIWTEPALADLDAIAEYIALDDSRAAKRYVTKVFRKVGNLAEFPELGHIPVELLDFEPYRQIVIAPCRVFYKIQGDDVIVLHVIRSERQFRLRSFLKRDE